MEGQEAMIEFHKWLESEKKAVQDAAKLLRINTEILEQHYDKIMGKCGTYIFKLEKK